MCRVNVSVVWLILVLCIGISLCENPERRRYKDELFPESLNILGQKVTCGNVTLGKFPARTWTCSNISVNGSRIAYGYNSASIGPAYCTETKGKHEFDTLCVEMLKAIGIDKPLWAAYVEDASCEKYSQTRYILTKVNNTFEWKEMPPGHGFVKTFQCMIQK